MKGRVIKDCLDGIEEVLKEYADKENYWTTSRSLTYISNGHTDETLDCTCCDPDEAIKGLYQLHKLKEQMNEENNEEDCKIKQGVPEGKIISGRDLREED